VVQKPVQDIYTVVLFAGFLLLLAMTAAMAVTILEQSGMVLSDASLTTVQAANPTAATAYNPVYERNGYNDCEVIYHQASQGGEYAEVAAPEAEQNAMGVFYHAVYTCTGTTATTGDYI
jgi:hypothetical protein